MAVWLRRNRIISVRVSEEEFQKLHLICHGMGMRSVSELARHALQRLYKASEETQAADLRERMDALEQRLSRLAESLCQLQERRWGKR